MTPTFEFLIAAAAFALIVVITAVTLAVLQSRAIVRLRRECNEMHELLTHVRREAHSAVTYASDVGKRLRKTEKELAALTDRLGQIELHGDSRSFAELMSVVHGGKVATG